MYHAYKLKALLNHDSSWISQIACAVQNHEVKEALRLLTDRYKRDYLERYHDQEMYDDKRSYHEYIKRSSMPADRASILYSVIHAIKPQTHLELGTCFGFTAMVAAAAHTGGAIHSVDLQDDLQQEAEKIAHKNGYQNITYYAGTFDVVLPELLPHIAPIKTALLDGGHTETEVFDELDMVLPHMAEQSVLLLDDIHHSDNMRKCWKKLRQLEWVAASIQFPSLGVCIIDKHSSHSRKLEVNLPFYSSLYS